MPAVLRLARAGAKKHPVYHLVAADQRSPRDGRFIEKLGVYNPNRSPAEITLDLSRVDYWISVGAQTSETAGSVIAKAREAEAAAPEA